MMSTKTDFHFVSSVKCVNYHTWHLFKTEFNYRRFYARNKVSEFRI